MVPGNGPYAHNVIFKNIEVYGDHKEGTTWGTILMQGLNEKHNVQFVTFEKFIRYGQPLKADSPDLVIGPFVDQVYFK